MKRLLAYLFIVLGLGLTFSVNTKADNYCIPKKAENHFNSIYIWEECYVYHKKVDLNTFVEFALTNALNSVGVRKESPLFVEENLKWLKKYLRENNISKSKINKSIKRVKIAKKEPGKTQKINIENCREVNALSGKVRFLENNEAPILYKNINIDFLNKRIEFEKNKNWVKDNSKSKKIYETRFKFGPNDNIILSNVVGMHLGTSVLIEIDYKSGVIKQGQNQQMKLICEKINNTKTQFAKLFDGKSLNIEKTVITKKEPSQTQKVTETVSLQLNKNEVDAIFSSVNSCWSIPLGLPYNQDLSVKIEVKFDPSGNAIRTEIIDHAKINKKGNAYLKVLAESALRAIKLCSPIRAPKDKYDLWKEVVFNFDAKDVLNGTESKDTKIAKNNLLKKYTETQITKAEPGQTQKVASKVFYDVAFCHPENTKPLSATITVWANIVGEKSKMKCAYNEAKFEDIYNYKELSICLGNKKTGSGSLKNYFYGQVGPVSCSGNLWPLAIKYDGERFFSEKKTQIAKTETTAKPKKKVKVVKKEPKQEEFKPKKTNQDNEAPVIEIAEAITVNDSTYEIEGKVIDKSKKLFVQIDGETIPVKKGKFKIKRFSPVDEQLKIVALDQWGNKSKPKLVNITIDLKETELAEKLEQLNPSLIKSKSNKDRVALIIGIEKYEQTPAANFANLDAQYFYEYARKGFGISKSNIKLLVDEDADLVKSISSINKWLPSKIKKNKTELIIFFAGHGLASNNGQELYILPQDSDPDLLSRTALSRTELFEQIISLSPKSVTMFMDTCYSGISRDEKMLLASARPIRIIADDQDGIPNNFTIFSASKLDQISSGLKEAKHGIFSYYLMKGLEGKADINQDNKITNGELLAYMDQNVSQKASELGRQQNPSLAGDPNKVLMSYR